jgi:hypothetical protein
VHSDSAACPVDSYQGARRPTSLPGDAARSPITSPRQRADELMNPLARWQQTILGEQPRWGQGCDEGTIVADACRTRDGLGDEDNP